MRISPLLASFLAIGFLSAQAPSANLAKIDRTIAKEPAYQTNTPKYCLLVFGPEARTHLWLVLDGDLLHVFGNGDPSARKLSEQKMLNHHQVWYGSRGFDVGDVTEVDGKT